MPFRQIRRSLAFTTIAVFTLALARSENRHLSVVDNVLLRPFLQERRPLHTMFILDADRSDVAASPHASLRVPQTK